MLPLTTLLSQALVAYTIEFDNEFERQTPHRTTLLGQTGGGGPWLVSMVMWFNCLRRDTDRGDRNGAPGAHSNQRGGHAPMAIYRSGSRP
jgi:hypothetical protein